MNGRVKVVMNIQYEAFASAITSGGRRRGVDDVVSMDRISAKLTGRPSHCGTSSKGLG